MTTAPSVPADTALALRDRALPGLEVVLDGERFTALLGERVPEAGVTAARPTYVRYKPETACVVGYDLTTAEGDIDAYVRLERPQTLDKLAKHATRNGATGASLIPGTAMALYRFPADRRVSALAELADSERRRRVLARTLPDDPGFWDGRITFLRRKAERRVVARLDAGDGRSAALKAHAGDFPPASRAAKVLGGGLSPRTPARLGRSRKWGVVVSEWLHGGLLIDDVLDGRLAGVAAAGAALAELHRWPPADLPQAGRPAETHALLASARLLVRLLPTRAAEAQRLGRRIAAELPAEPPVALTHGDFSADQILLGPDGIALLDLDAAVLADPARDLGIFRAALEREVVRGRLSADGAEGIATQLLDSYGGMPAARLRPWTAAALLKLASEPFRHRDPEWPRAVSALLDAAERTVAA
jgi:aminoglycoside phosphotransferase (APT) family kinase protein